MAIARIAAICSIGLTCKCTRSARTRWGRRCSIASMRGIRRFCRRMCGATASRRASNRRAARRHEEHGPRGAEAWRGRGERLHGLEHLAPALLVSAGARVDDRDGYKQFADRWNPILDVFGECGVRFALEVHPTRDRVRHRSRRSGRSMRSDNREEFGFNFDPSHLLWQGVDPVEFIREFPDRIYHVHIKDAIVTLNGRSGILSSHLQLGDPRRGWDFGAGPGSVNFEEIIRALNQIKYEGPLSVEFEDPAWTASSVRPRPATLCRSWILSRGHQAQREMPSSPRGRRRRTLLERRPAVHFAVRSVAQFVHFALRRIA